MRRLGILSLVAVTLATPPADAATLFLSATLPAAESDAWAWIEWDGQSGKMQFEQVATIALSDTEIDVSAWQFVVPPAADLPPFAAAAAASGEILFSMLPAVIPLSPLNSEGLQRGLLFATLEGLPGNYLIDVEVRHPHVSFELAPVPAGSEVSDAAGVVYRPRQLRLAIQVPEPSGPALVVLAALSVTAVRCKGGAL